MATEDQTLIELEKAYIAHGKEYELSGDDLRAYVDERLTRSKDEREQRRLAREEVKAKVRMEEQLQTLQQQVEQLTTGSGETGSRTSVSASDRRQVTIKVPKYDNKQDVEQYLQLFEDVCKKNGFDPEDWLLRLRIAVSDSSLVTVCMGCSTYDEAKKEIMKSLGRTPDTMWKKLLVNQQKADESFHHYVVRIGHDVEAWHSMAIAEKDEDRSHSDLSELSPTLGAVLKQLVLEAIGAEMKAHLVEQGCYMKGYSLREFIEIGTAYQTAHGRTKKDKSASKPQASKGQSTTQCFHVSTKETEEKLEPMSVSERYSHVRAQRLCWNCLKTGHMAEDCYSKSKCDKCSRKHHKLLHRGEALQVKAIGSVGCEQTGKVRLMTGVAEVEGQTKSTRVRVFIDPGAQASFVSDTLVDAVKPKLLGTERVTVKGFGSEPTTEQMSRYRFVIAGATKPVAVTAWKRPALALEIKRVDRRTAKRMKSQGVTVSDAEVEDVPNEIHLLIGADFCNELLISKRSVDGETVWESEIGWLLSGPATPEPDTQATVKVNTIELERLWHLDEPEVKAPIMPDFPMERTRSGYQVGLLWKSTERPDDNCSQAMAQAQSLLNKLTRQGKRAAYDDVLIREYMELGAVEKEPHPETSGYYMPHHAVFRSEAATTKTRVVFNASASMAEGKSLNDVVDAGPSLLPDLTGILIRFREYPWALQADIRKAFFMIGMREEDRPFMRFIWPEIGSEEMCIWRLQKLPFGVNCSPFVLNAVLHHHLESLVGISADEHAVIQLLLRSFYVDDMLTSVPGSPEAEKLQEFSTRSLQGAGFELRKWRGNHISSDPAAGEKALGVPWDPDTDTIGVASVGDVSDVAGWSRRLLLRLVASIYDPLGLASPVVLGGKKLLQEAWKEGGEWDDPLSERLAQECSKWWSTIPGLADIRVPRWIGGQQDVPVTLHVFADASEKGYGCCVYVVQADSSSLLFAKAKVAPVATQTLARLELQAAYLASKVIAFVVGELRLNVERVVGWTDSLTTWHWISAPSYRWKTFVANRVATVQEVAAKFKVEWHHCPGTENPADLASRGVSPEELKQSKWLQGPSWLGEESRWPNASVSSEGTSESAQEVRVAAVEIESLPIDWSRFSSWNRARGVVCRLLSWRHKDRSRAELIPLAEAIMVRAVQADCFPEELSLLRRKEPIAAGSKLRKLSPWLDEGGMLRVGGRLQQSDIAYEAKHQMILGKHHLTRLLLEKMHRERLHQGVESVLAHVYHRYWVMGGRRELRSITEKCVVCRRHGAKPASEVTPPLPADRVVHQRPFAVVGIDFAGPLYVREGDATRKVWIALFVCATTRAVHLEVVDSLSTESFLLSLQRFMARRGKPQLIRSDNATTFKSASERLDVSWKFNPPAAPWHGGFFERMVGTVKGPLRKVLGRASLGVRELETVLAQVESVVNTRPLTHVSPDETPLTPAMMMGEVWNTDEAVAEEALAVRQMASRHKYVMLAAQHVCTRWRAEYLHQLQSYHQAKSRPVSAGDVVLIVDESKKKHLWRMALVQELYPGRDGKSRIAKVKVGSSSMLRPVQRLVSLEVAAAPAAPAKEVEPSLPPVNPPAVVDDAVATPSVPVEPDRRSRRARKAVDRMNL